MDSTWLTQNAVTVASAGLTCGAVSLARYVLAESRRRGRGAGCWPRLFGAGSVATLSLGVGCAVAAGCVERLSPWQAFAFAVLASASVDVTSLRQIRKLLSTTLRGWLALLDENETTKKNETDE